MGEINIIKSPHYNMPFTSPIGHKHFQHTFFSKPISLKGNTVKKSYPYKICYLPNKKNLESLKREREREICHEYGVGNLHNFLLHFLSVKSAIYKLSHDTSTKKWRFIMYDHYVV